jgi:hypothetical protein
LFGVIAAAGESIGYQVFGPETQATYLNWLSAWHRVKHWGGSFTIQLGGQNLHIETNQFINCINALQPLIQLGEALARSYQTIGHNLRSSE